MEIVMLSTKVRYKGTEYTVGLLDFLIFHIFSKHKKCLRGYDILVELRKLDPVLVPARSTLYPKLKEYVSKGFLAYFEPTKEYCLTDEGKIFMKEIVIQGVPKTLLKQIEILQKILSY